MLMKSLMSSKEWAVEDVKMRPIDDVNQRSNRPAVAAYLGKLGEQILLAFFWMMAFAMEVVPG